MNTAGEHIDDLIASYLAGEATGEEIAFVEAWKEKHESNRRYFDQIKLIFEKAGAAAVTEAFDTDRAWQKLQGRLALKKRGKTTPFIAPPSGYHLFMKIAAGIIVLLTIGFFSYNFFKTGAVHSVGLATDRKTEADTLPDGSGVFLNRQTKIEYSFSRKEHTHRAKLEGEAYFNINHNKDQTFIVEAEGTFIRDVGTSFNVKAYPDAATIEVVVEEGEVAFYTEGNPGVYLKAGGKGIYNKHTKTFTVGEPEGNVTAYKTKFFSFSSDSLAEVVETLNKVYDTEIHIDENLKACRLTVSFNDENIDEISKIIAETLGLTVSKSGNVIFLKGPGCGGVRP